MYSLCTLIFKMITILFLNFRFQFKINLNFLVQEKLLEVISTHTTGILVRVQNLPVAP